MERDVYRYSFTEQVELEDVQATLVLAVIATESLHGQSKTHLDAAHYLDANSRTCIIDANTEVGRHLNQVFVGYLLREFGGDCFQVGRARKSADIGEGTG